MIYSDIQYSDMMYCPIQYNSDIQYTKIFFVDLGVVVYVDTEWVIWDFGTKIRLNVINQNWISNRVAYLATGDSSSDLTEPGRQISCSVIWCWSNVTQNKSICVKIPLLDYCAHSVNSYVCIIPRLHDEAGSTSWLDEVALRALVGQLVERSTSARRALDEPARRASFLM